MVFSPWVQPRSVSKEKRNRVYKRDRNRCRYCGIHFKPEHLTVDHIMPLSKGGTNDLSNLVTACVDCNTAKGSKLLRNPAKAKKLPKVMGRAWE